MKEGKYLCPYEFLLHFIFTCDVVTDFGSTEVVVETRMYEIHKLEKL